MNTFETVLRHCLHYSLIISFFVFSASEGFMKEIEAYYAREVYPKAVHEQNINQLIPRGMKIINIFVKS